jgi:surface antigen
MLNPYIAAVQIGQLQIQSTYTRPVTAIVETAPEPHNPILNQEELDKIIKHQKPIEPLKKRSIAKLKPKPLPKPKVATKAPKRAVSVAPAGWYPAGQCTWWVWSKRPVPGWNDASDWLWQAKRDGWTVSNTPVAGAIGWEPGHVVYVETISSSGVRISEANYDRAGSIRTITRPIGRYIYIY